MGIETEKEPNMIYYEDLDRHYFWCGKRTDAKNGRRLYGKVKRTCFAVCEANCKKYKDVMDCQNYFEALEEATETLEEATA